MKSSLPNKTYFISAHNCRAIKIGKAVDPVGRLGQLQTGSPVALELIGVIDADVESELHVHFSSRRLYRGKVKTEWFRKCDEIVSLAENAQQFSSPTPRVHDLGRGRSVKCDVRIAGAIVPLGEMIVDLDTVPQIASLLQAFALLAPHDRALLAARANAMGALPELRDEHGRLHRPKTPLRYAGACE